MLGPLSSESLVVLFANRFMTEFDSKQLAVAYPGPAPYPIHN